MKISFCFESKEQSEKAESEANFENSLSFYDILEDDVLRESMDDIVKSKGIGD